jgi:hypothetical protein
MTNQSEPSKQKCRDMIATLDAAQPGRVVAMFAWIDGVWRDYWYVTLDGQDVGEIWYDSFGPVVKGDKLGTLVYRASIAAERAAAKLLASTEHGHRSPDGVSRCWIDHCSRPDTHLVRPIGDTPRPTALADGQYVCVCTSHADAFRLAHGYEIKDSRTSVCYADCPAWHGCDCPQIRP